MDQDLKNRIIVYIEYVIICQYIHIMDKEVYRQYRLSRKQVYRMHLEKLLNVLIGIECNKLFREFLFIKNNFDIQHEINGILH